MLGITDSPHHACQAVTWAKCIAIGDQLEPNNLFAWKKVVLNLPGTKEYYFQKPWVFKQRVDGLLTAELFICVDNGQTIGPTKKLFWEASIRWGSTCSWLGIQGASIKVQPPS